MNKLEDAIEGCFVWTFIIFSLILCSVYMLIVAPIALLIMLVRGKDE